jgi:drug/metabolite transporter (DMT)-like permease
VTIFAISFLGESPSILALCGAVLITVGVLVLSGNWKELRESGAYKGVVFALLTGGVIAIYTLWDRHAVRDLNLPPLLYLWAGGVVQVLILAPYAIRHWGEVRQTWQLQWKSAIGVGVISIFAYALILFALTFSPVSYIAPAREISVLVGSLMGSRVLAEHQPARRIVAALAMVLGLAALAFG